MLALVALAFMAYAWRPAIEPVEPPSRSSFDPASIARGAQLALIGNCNVCHTADGRPPYAGGRPLQTPFGTIYSTNITPDPATGIGRWSEEAFRRAMREGVDRRGRHLYPAFPYDHYTRMSDEDIAAVYAFLMTRHTASAETPVNEVTFPANVRMLLAGWKLLFLRPGAYRHDASRDAAWNRGAYLVQGPGHCGACHTPRNFLGAEKQRAFLAGGISEGWNAPPLNPASATPEPWTEQALAQYLRHGIAERHAIAAGPMGPVVRNLSAVPEEEIQAMAAYLVAFTTRTQVAKPERQESLGRAALDAVSPVIPPPTGAGERDGTWAKGRAIYVDACGGCHDIGRETASSGSALHLSLATAIHLPEPGNLIRIIREGITPPAGESGRWMPAYAGALAEEQMAALVHYLRADFAKSPAWRNVEDEVRRASSTNSDLQARQVAGSSR